MSLALMVAIALGAAASITAPAVAVGGAECTIVGTGGE